MGLESTNFELQWNSRREACVVIINAGEGCDLLQSALLDHPINKQRWRISRVVVMSNWTPPIMLFSDNFPHHYR